MALLYRKIVLWMDLNITSDDFVHAKVVEVMGMIDNYKDQLNYVPSKINYTDIQMASDGIYSLAQKEEGAGNSEAMDNLHALAEAVIDMENIIKNNFKLSEEKRTKFVDNNPVMTTLREELEQAFKDKKKLEELNQ